MVEQDVLVEMKGRRPIKLPEPSVCPASEDKRLSGEVEVHQNGIRYQSPISLQKIGTDSIARCVVMCNLPVHRHSLQQRQASSSSPVVTSS